MMLHIANFRVYLLFIKTFCSIVITGEIVGAYEVPPAIIVPLKPVGFTVSVPDHPGITLFAFHGNINKDFENGREAGEMAVDVLRKKNGFWTYTNRDRKLKEGDIIYYWLYVIKDGLGYERLFQSYMVDGFGEPTSTSTTTTTTTTTTRKPSSRPVTTSVPPQSVTDFIDIRNPGAGPCKLGITTVNGERACQGYLIFDSDFSQEIGRNWTKEVHFNRDESEFVVFDRRETNSYIESNHLTIQPTLLDDEYGADFTRRGPLDLTERCTSHDPLLCKQDTIGFSILPPVISARLTTKDRFSFKYGTVDIRAKLPKGNWVVPEIWLLPKAHRPYGSDKSGRIVIAKSIGNALLTYDDIPLGNSVLTAGLEVNEKTNKTFRKITYNGLWSERFHNFKLDWTPSGVIFYVDNEPYGTWEGDREPLLKGYGPVSPFDQEFYLSLGIHVGGYYDVINGAVSGGREKPWSNSHPKRLFSFYQDLKNWHATWNDQTKLKVDYIRVYAL